MALPLARRLIDAHNRDSRRPVSLVATGGIRTPDDVIKALALGADACAVATAALFALGCEYYRACHTGNCPVGITTQSEALRGRVDPDTAAQRVANYLTSTRKVLESYLRLMGHTHMRDLSQSDLLALTPEAGSLLHAR
jgi:glutamate synthase domain-containing protein 2